MLINLLVFVERTKLIMRELVLILLNNFFRAYQFPRLYVYLRKQ